MTHTPSRRPQFRLRTLFVVTTVAAIAMAAGVAYPNGYSVIAVWIGVIVFWTCVAVAVGEVLRRAKPDTTGGQTPDESRRR